MKKKYSVIVYSVMLASAAGLGACTTANQEKPSAAMSSQASGSQGRSGAQKPQDMTSENLRRGQQDKSSLDALRSGESARTSPGSAMKEVYFDFDRYDLDAQDRAVLRANAAWLKKNPASRVEVEGHCDERGTNEYNLALGAKRAQAAKDYLMTLGVAPNRISTTSYGEEIPVCREHNEDCWQKNRRDRFVSLAGKPAM